MKTYQDLLEARQKGLLQDFIPAAIAEYRNTDEYKNGVIGRDYMRQQNTTIRRYAKWLYDQTGRATPDMYSPNYKCASAYYKANNIQLTQHLLSNGVYFAKETTKAALGGAKFDNKLVRATRAALSEGRAYGFFNNGEVEILRFDEFVPLFDEENGAIRAGIRHWQFAETKPKYFVLYEEGGFTEMRQAGGQPLVCVEGSSFETPRPYKTRIATLPTGAAEIVAYENYPAFPIVPIYGNYDKQAEIVGKREHIDCYDLVESGFANNIEEASFVYWVLNNAGGMDDIDMAEFKRRIRELRVAKTDDDTSVAAHTVDVPAAAREALLTRLENDIYSDAMTVNLDRIAGGEVRATAINAAFKRLNDRVDELEYCVGEFIAGLLALAGIDDTPSFNRSNITNEEEVTQMVLSSAEYLDYETLLSKLPFLSDDDRKNILARKDAESVNRYINAELTPAADNEAIE